MESWQSKQLRLDIAPVKKIRAIQLPILPKCTSKDRTTCRMSGREGVRLYKALHRTVQRVFRGDRAAMFAARDKVTPGIFCNLL